MLLVKKESISKRMTGVTSSSFILIVSDMDTLELAWGVDIDPAIAMVSLAFGKLSHLCHVIRT